MQLMLYNNVIVKLNLSIENFIITTRVTEKIHLPGLLKLLNLLKSNVAL